MSLKLIFLGTPDFAATVLKKILKSRHVVTAVITQPDRPANRNKIVTGPVKALAQSAGIQVFQFEKLRRDGLGALASADADVMVTCAYGQILSEEILNLKKYGVLNVHASLLPKYRGSSPIQWAVVNGETETGITIMRTAYEVDSGDILLQKRTPISPCDTGGSMLEKLAEIGGDAIVEALDLLERGEAAFTPQDDSLAVHVPMLKKSDGLIDFSLTADRLNCFVRGMTPWPSAFSYLKGRQIKVLKSDKIEYDGSEPYGAVVYADAKRGLVVRCGGGAARLSRLRPEGGSEMSDVEYLRGHAVSVGEEFGGKL